MTNSTDPKLNEASEEAKPLDKEDKAVLKRAEFRKDKAESKPQKELVIEHSVAMRWAAFVMIMTTIFGACLYVQTPGVIIGVYLWMAGMGVYLAYKYREKRPFWLPIIPTAGAVFVIFAFIVITAKQLQAHSVNFLGPFLQVLAGLLALHCYDLRSREDFSVSILIALGVFTFTAGAANDYSFLGLVASFILSLSYLLYFDSVSRSQGVGPSKPVGEGRPASMPKPVMMRSAKVQTLTVLLPILSVPLITIMVFYSIPRQGSIIEWLMRDLVSPYFAISNTERGTGYNPDGQKGGSRGNELGGNLGGANGPGTGSQGAGSAPGAGQAGDPDKKISPIGGENGDSSSATSMSGAAGSSQQKEFEETVEDKPEQVDLLQSSLPANKIVFRIQAARAAYARRASYDYYDGISWTRTGPISGVAFRKDRGNVFGIGNANALLVPSDCPTVKVKQKITVELKEFGKFLVGYSIPQAMGGPFERVTVQSDGALKLDKSFGDGSTYEVVSRLPVYKLSQMRNLPIRTRSHFDQTILGPPVEELEKTEQALIEKYLQLPESIPDKLKALSKKVAGKNGNWFVKAERIAKYLKKNCKYKQNFSDRPKDGDFVYNFLYKTRVGNCLEYSSAFVVMARAAGIPARCVGGYLPGTLNKKTGFYEVKVKDGHAWGEIYLPDWSWIPFDATPVGGYPEVEEEQNILSKLADLGLSNPFGGALSTPSMSVGAGIGQGIAGSELDQKLNNQDKDIESKGADSDESKSLLEKIAGFKIEYVVFPFVILGTLLVVYFVYRDRKKEGEIPIPDNAKKSTLIYLDLMGDLKRYEIVRLPYETPGDIQSRIRTAFELSRSEGRNIPSQLEPLIEQFMELYNRDRFGRLEKLDQLEDMSKQIKELVKSSRNN